MKKQNILKKNLDFQKVIETKKQFINKNLILYYQEWNSCEIGISIPKKFANAVKRNFLKRQIKWILDLFVDYETINFRIVLIIRKDFINLSLEEKKEQLVKMFSKFIKFR